MARDYLCLDATPAEEDAEQCNRAEVKRYCRMLEKRFPEWEEQNVSFRCKAFPHDFGYYAEACVFFDNEDDEFAVFVADNLPATWNDQTVLHLKRWPPYVN